MSCRSKLRSSRPAIWLTLLAVLGTFSIPLQAQVQTFLETDFESGIPAGWTQQQITGGATWRTQTGGTANGGAGNNPASARSGNLNATLFFNSNTSDNTARLITPALDTTGHINLTLTFWHTQEMWFSDQDTLKVFYSSNGGTSWTQLAHYTQSIAEWTRRDLLIPASGSDIRIAFEGDVTWGHGVCLDDVSVQGIPDTFSEVSVTATDAEASEEGPDTGTWTITRTGNTSGPLTVNYTLSGSAEPGIDYTVDPPSPVSFADGETSKVVTLTPVDDAVAEGVEVATLTLAPGSGYVVNDLADSADISILDNDPFDLNILIIGSANSFSDGGESGVVHQKAFNPTGTAHHLQNIIAQDAAISDTVNVVFDNIFKTKTQTVNTSGSSTAVLTSHCYSLAQHYFWTDGMAERLANLRGEGENQWDYIILTFDPYIMANFPGMVAEGVKLIQDEVARSANPAQLILLAQWPEDSSTFTADQFNEVAYRVGNSAGLSVVPAGKAWDGYGSKDTSTNHPTPKGEYLAASAIYSTIYDRSAKTSAYVYPSDGSTIADHALAVVQANHGVAQYAGAYDSAYHTFNMKYVAKRLVHFRHTGTSTERGIRDALYRLAGVQRITFTESGYAGVPGTRWDFNYGRGNDGWEPEKQYKVDPEIYDRSYGFPMLHYTMANAPNTMPYVIDKHYSSSSAYVDATDLGIAYNMIRPGTREPGVPEDVRAIPIRFMWLKMREISPGFHPLRDNTHYSHHVDDASAAFIYTLLSGRCPVAEEPEEVGSTEWLRWLGHKIGYETAWQMAQLTTRAPGFRVLPSATSKTTVSPTSPETMTVQFMNPPQSNVTVTVAASQGTAALVSPQTLTFTPVNYNLPQEVTVIGLPGAPSSQPFEVVFTTSSDDEIYDGLSDAWAYTTTRSSTTTVTQVDNGTSQLATSQFTTLDINLGVTGANSGNTIFAGPSHGSITWGGTQDIQYTPSGDFVGADQIVYAVTIGGTQTLGAIDILVQLPDGQVNVIAEYPLASGDGPDTGTFTISRLGETTDALDVYFSLSGTATFGDDYTLSHTSPITIPAGESSITLTLTPNEDDSSGQRDETAILTISENPAYPIGIASATITFSLGSDITPPAILTLDPAHSNSGVSPSTNLNITFDEPIAFGTGNITLRQSGGALVEGFDVGIPSAGLSLDGASITINPTSNLSTATTYYVEIDATAIEDLAGNAFAGISGDGTWSFTTTAASADTVALDFGTPTSNVQTGYTRVTTNGGQNDGTALVGGNISVSMPAGQFLHYRDRGQTASFTDLTNLELLRDIVYVDGLGASDVITFAISGLTANAEYEVYGYAVDMFNATTNDNKTVTWTTSGGSVNHTTDSGNEDFSSARFQMASMTANSSGVATITAQTAGGIVLWNGFDIVAIAAPNITFNSWIGGFSGLGGLTGLGDDPDGDGIPNGLENFFGTHPGEFSQGVIAGGVTHDGDTTFTFTHPLNESPASNLAAAYRWSKDLTSFHGDGAAFEGTTVTFVRGAAVDGIVTVAATVTGTPVDRLFIDIEVTEE